VLPVFLLGIWGQYERLRPTLAVLHGFDHTWSLSMASLIQIANEKLQSITPKAAIKTLKDPVIPNPVLLKADNTISSKPQRKVVIFIVYVLNKYRLRSFPFHTRPYTLASAVPHNFQL
jgi:hypothetical protein